MARPTFLNPYLKAVICMAGMACMGYFLYPVLLTGSFSDALTIARALVFLGFTYLFVATAREIIRNLSHD